MTLVTFIIDKILFLLFGALWELGAPGTPSVPTRKRATASSKPNLQGHPSVTCLSFSQLAVTSLLPFLTERFPSFVSHSSVRNLGVGPSPGQHPYLLRTCC